jgi:predicted alpha-1,2-mannosidase
MLRLRFLAGCLCLLLQAAVAQGQAAKPSDFVDTLRGSDSSATLSRGSTFPAVAVPFGFNLWTPVTQPNSAGWLYEYKDSTVQGFAVSHQSSPRLGDYATFQIMPSLGELRWQEGERGQAFTHAHELARAHYYRVDLDSGIRVELTPTLHAAALRITFPARGARNLLFDAPDKASGAMTADAAQGTVSGSIAFRGLKLYFFARLDTPGQSVVAPTTTGPGVAISFDQKAQRTVTLRIGTSYISLEQAQAHVEEELAERSFDEVQAQARAVWDGYLGRIQIEDASDSQKLTFYSNLYRALLYPNTMTELVDGVPKHFSPYVDNVRAGPMYVNNGLWASYRAAWPLYVLLLPQQAGTMLQGSVNAYREGGWMPRSSAPGYRDPMLGTHSDTVFADAYAKGVRNFDVNAAYDAMLKNALVMSNQVGKGRAGMARGTFRNFIPNEDTTQAAAWHLENCVNDFSISRLARALGDETHAEYLRLRSLNYAALYSPTVGFFTQLCILLLWVSSEVAARMVSSARPINSFDPRSGGTSSPKVAHGTTPPRPVTIQED